MVREKVELNGRKCCVRCGQTTVLGILLFLLLFFSERDQERGVERLIVSGLVAPLGILDPNERERESVRIIAKEWSDSPNRIECGRCCARTPAA